MHNKIWWVEVEDLLRREWNSEFSWDEIISLRDCLQAKLDEIRGRLGIRDRVYLCRACHQEHTDRLEVTVNALLYRLCKLGLETEEEIHKKSYRWKKYRKEYGLDSTGKKVVEKEVSKI